MAVDIIFECMLIGGEEEEKLQKKGGRVAENNCVMINPFQWKWI